MMDISEEAVEMLKEKLVGKCSELGIGFRLVMENSDSGERTFVIKIDRPRDGDEILEAGGVKLFLDPAETAQTDGYELDYINEPSVGFILK